MDVTLLVPVQISQTTLNRISRYYFIKAEEWTPFAGSNIVLTGKFAQAMSSTLIAGAKGLKRNSTIKKIEKMPEASKRKLLEELGFHTSRIRKKTFDELVEAIEASKNARVVIFDTDEGYRAIIVEDKTSPSPAHKSRK